MNAYHRNRRGSLETLSDGRARLYRAGFGYVTKAYGYSAAVRKARVFSGPGEAIREAAAHGFAILSW